MPVRVTKRYGFSAPEGVIYVGRPTKYGNPWKVKDHGLAEALRLYRNMLDDKNQRKVIGYPSDDVIRRELRGRDLQCWCDLDKPCHADILMEIANR